MMITPKDREILAHLHPDLIRVVENAAQLTDQNFVVFEGLRTKVRQQMLVRTKKSKTMASRHITGHAVDLVPLINGQPTWQVHGCNTIAVAMIKSAHTLGIKLRWGGDWDGDGETKDERFYDGPHFELPRSAYGDTRVTASGYAPHRVPETRIASQLETSIRPTHGTRQSGDALRAQKFLKLEQDGVYGPVTRAAIKQFQRKHKLVQDGIWGPLTEAKAESLR